LVLEDILTATCGKPVFSRICGSLDVGVAVDSRAVKPGDLFIPLPGERTDGHRFIEDAVKSGASGFFVSESCLAAEGKRIERICDGPGSPYAIAVPDTLRALQAVGKHRVEKLSGTTRIGITGSSGKTTTKELLGAILREAGATWYNEGNLNSEIGLPMACAGIPDGVKYAVFEMGMNRRGEMDILADIVRPDLAAVTGIGTAHVGMIGSVEGIAAEKKRIFSRFTGPQTGFLPEGDRFTPFLAEGVRGTIRLFGRTKSRGFAGYRLLGLDGSEVSFDEGKLMLHLPGEHNVDNLLCAVEIARFLGVDFRTIARGTENVRPLFGRGEILAGEVTVIKDCYNANPESMEKAIEFASSIPWAGRKVFVFGSMKELGDRAEELHGRLGAIAAASKADLLFFFGEEAEWAFHEAMALRGSGVGVFHETDYASLEEKVTGLVEEGDLVLVKGSRSTMLERLADTLAASGKEGRVDNDA
jgi:UDP-N-acetylmuramoyl-tripeptide--D-alanyl-D-alanine ligase